MVRVKTQKQETAAPQGELRKGTARPRRGTRVRTRCSEQWKPDEEVRTQFVEAMPHIVKASVEKAKSGSLLHTKWLWGVIENLPKKQSEEAALRASLAELLMEQLREQQ